MTERVRCYCPTPEPQGSFQVVGREYQCLRCGQLAPESVDREALARMFPWWDMSRATEQPVQYIRGDAQQRGVGGVSFPSRCMCTGEIPVVRELYDEPPIHQDDRALEAELGGLPRYWNTVPDSRVRSSHG